MNTNISPLFAWMVANEPQRLRQGMRVLMRNMELARRALAAFDDKAILLFETPGEWLYATQNDVERCRRLFWGALDRIEDPLHRQAARVAVDLTMRRGEGTLSHDGIGFPFFAVQPSHLARFIEIAQESGMKVFKTRPFNAGREREIHQLAVKDGRVVFCRMPVEARN